MNKKIRKFKSLRRYIWIILILCAPVVTIYYSAKAQETNPTWNKQQRLTDHYFDSFAPQLIADQNKTVHAFHYTDLGNEDSTDKGVYTAIYYRQWNIDSSWTVPIDIIIPPAGSPEFSLQGVFLDGAGYFHLIFYGGDPVDANIYYSRAPAHLAGRASAWSDPIIIGEAAGPVARAALAGDEDGNLLVLYGGRKKGPGIYAIHSQDAGNNWSSPELMYISYQKGFFPITIELILDEQGNAHAVWSIYNSVDASADEVYYAGMDADDKRWNKPIKLAQKDRGDYEADWPSIVTYHDELIVLYMDSKPATRWMRRSQDGGETWTEPIRPFQLNGENGAAVLLIDSNDDLHAVMGNRTSEGDVINHGMWHSVWQEDRWGPVEAIVSGPTSPDFDPTQPEAVISQGNVLFTTWTKDTTLGPRNGAWYSYTTLDTPELPVEPLPVPETEPDPVLASTPFPQSGPLGALPNRRQEETLQDEGIIPLTRQNPLAPIVLSLVLVSILLVVVILQRLLIFRR